MRRRDYSISRFVDNWISCRLWCYNAGYSRVRCYYFLALSTFWPFSSIKLGMKTKSWLGNLKLASFVEWDEIGLWIRWFEVFMSSDVEGIYFWFLFILGIYSPYGIFCVNVFFFVFVFVIVLGSFIHFSVRFNDRKI